MYARLKAYEGRAAAVGGVGKDLVNEPMIRHWCEAMGDTNPAYAGPDAVAPPTMLQAWTMGGLSGHGGGGRGRSEAYDELLGLLDGAGYTSVVATDCEQEYLRPLRPGDEITFDAVIESVSERKTTKLGTGYFVTTRMDVRAGGEPAGTHRFRILKYVPAARRASTTETAGAIPRGAETASKAGAGAVAGRGAAALGPTRTIAVTGATGATSTTGARGTTGASEESAERAGPAAGEAGAKDVRPRRPRPVVNRDNAGFWEGVSRHRLLIQRCDGCKTLRFPWLPGCNACGCLEWDTVEAAGEGIVYSYVVMHHPPFPAFSGPDHGAAASGPFGPSRSSASGSSASGPHVARPYAVGLIELAEGVRMISNVVGVPYDRVRIGMPVRLEFERVDEELELPLFRAVEGSGG
ncbi:OB-fold domain-containing protein [Streptomyces sp. NPDC050704]|uniref:bifunctional MaoC family dehydratase N-terminal/OB-fold nucleic acid binding domain-containing protein n=1 Tax=Streptomyces sp. NPDC050704 TaxID=3157219 RepID=UPI00341B394B